jgi:hypothetical protein
VPTLTRPLLVAALRDLGEIAAAAGKVVDLAARFYPEARVSGKLRLALDDLWRAYERHPEDLDGPPGYLGRGRAADGGRSG